MSHIHPKFFFLRVLIKSFQLLLCIWLTPLNAVYVELLNSTDNPSSINKAYVQFTFEPDDAALFKDTIKISIDSPAVQITKWNMLAEPTNRYFAAFRTSKRVFTQTCTAKVTISFMKPADTLTNVHLTISGIKQSMSGKNSPFSYIISLKKHQIHDAEFVLSTSSEFFPPTTHSLAPTHTAYSNIFHDQLTQEFQLLEKLSAIWEEIIQLTKSLFSLNFYLWWYCLLWSFFIGLLCTYFVRTLRTKPTNKPWFIQGFECSALILGLSSLPLAAPLLKEHLYVYLASCIFFMVFIGFFCLATSHEQSIWGKIKGIITWICLTCIFPIMTYAYLTWAHLI